MPIITGNCAGDRQVCRFGCKFQRTVTCGQDPSFGKTATTRRTDTDQKVKARSKMGIVTVVVRCGISDGGTANNILARRIFSDHDPGEVIQMDQKVNMAPTMICASGHQMGRFDGSSSEQ